MNMHVTSFIRSYSLRQASLRKRIDALIQLRMGSMALKKAIKTADSYERTINKLAARRCFERSAEMRMNHV